MNTKQKREALKGAYPGDKWAAKVDSMTDSEVVAIYLRLKKQGKV
jgi:hypothetical protein